ncbi:MAG: hypothetical protein IKW83_01440 [Muribaculaceae bacterium]|nr:hypothetical protein [Muribaculaceae bacterium]
MSNNTIDLRRHTREIKRHKWWIIASVAAFALLAFWYWQHHLPEYTVHSVMLIEEDEDNGSGGSISNKGGISQMMRAFSIGGFGASSVDNERIIAETHTVLLRTIKDLGLNCSVVGHNGIKRKVLYGSQCPIKVNAPSELYDTLSVSLKMNITFSGEKANIKVKKGMFSTVATLNDVSLPCEVKTPYGTFQVAHNDSCQPVKNYTNELTVSISGSESLVEYYRKKINLDLYDKKADAVEFTLDDPCPERGIDILNKMMENYNNVRKEHKDEISRKEIEFYDNRIASLAQELENADNRMVEFKKNNSIVDLENQAGAIIKQDAALQQEAVKLRAEMEINQMILNELNKNGYNVLPILGNDATSSAISQYNQLVVSKHELEKSARGENEALMSLNEKLSATKNSIITSAQRNIDASSIRLNELYASMGHDEVKKSQMPSQEKEYLNLLRDKELKNELFIFLMQRRESSMLQLTKNSSPSFVIDKAYSDVKPSLVKPLIVTLILLFMGVLLPLLLVLFRMKRRNRINDPFDLNEEWENQAVNVITKKKDQEAIEEQLRTIRAKLFHMKDIKQFLIYDVTKNNDSILKQLVETIEKSNKQIKTIKVANIDELYSDSYREKIEKASSADYIFTEITHLASLGQASDILSGEDKGLMLILKSPDYKRDKFDSLVKEYNSPEKAIVIITK